MAAQLAVVVLVLAYAGVGVASATRRNAAFLGADRLMHPMPNGMAITVGLLALVATPIGVNDPAGGKLTIVAAVAAGLGLAALAIAPPLARFGGVTVPDLIGERFGPAARLLATAIAIVISFPLLMLATVMAARILAGALNLEAEPAIALAVGVMLACTIFGGLRSAGMTQAVQCAVLLVLALLGIAVWLWSASPLTAAPFATASLDVWNGFVAEDAISRIALGVTLAGGVAAMPHLLMRSFAVPSGEAARWSYLWAIPLLTALLIAVPPIGSFAGGDAPFLAGVLVAAALTAWFAVGSGALLAIGNSLSYDILYRALDSRASAGARLLMGRLSLAAIAAAAGLLMFYEPMFAVSLAPLAFSIAASCFLPVLLLGIWIPRMTGYGAIAGMGAGLVISAGYFLAPRYAPDAFIALTHFLFGEGETAGDSGLHWFGVSGAFGAIFAVPAALLVTIVVSLVTPRPAPDIAAFAEQLRRRD